MLARLDSWLPLIVSAGALALIPACSGDGSDGETGGSTTSTTETGSGTSSDSASSSGSTSGDSAGSTTGTSSGSAGSTTGAVDYGHWELRVDNHPVAPVATDYVCFDFTLSVDALTHLVGFRPVLDNAPYVHHYVVELIDGPSQNPDGVGYACGPEAAFTWAWAPGIGDYFLPEEGPHLVPSLGDDVGGGPADDMSVEDIMSPVPFTVEPGTTVRELAVFLTQGRIHRALVTEDEHLVGIVTATDILRAIADEA